MKIIKPSGVLIPNPNPLNVLKFIEGYGRTAYQSYDKITEDSADRFCKMILDSGHHAVFECVHYTIQQPYTSYKQKEIVELHPHLTVKVYDDYIYIGGSLKTWTENKEGNVYTDSAISAFKEVSKFVPDIFKDMVFPRNIKPDDIVCSVLTREKDIPEAIFPDLVVAVVRFVADRGVSHELVRHRKCAYLQESTRYCNYSKGKYGNQISVIQPPFNKIEELDEWETICRTIEESYLLLISKGVKPQIARSILPNCLKTEIKTVASLTQWKYMLNLRLYNERAHPQMREIMKFAEKELISHYPKFF